VRKRDKVTGTMAGRALVRWALQHIGARAAGCQCLHWLNGEELPADLGCVGSGRGSVAGFPEARLVYTKRNGYARHRTGNQFNHRQYGHRHAGAGLRALFLYDPVHNKYDPWLASSGSGAGTRTPSRYATA